MKKPVAKQQVTALALFMAGKVRELREASGMTQAELASRSGVTVETVARLERVLRGRPSANANPSLETMQRIAGSLGVEAADLIQEGAPKRAEPLIAMLRSCKPDTRRRVLAVAEALIRDERKAG